jgi:hypothetical protein
VQSEVVRSVPVIVIVYHRLCSVLILIVTQLKEQQEAARALEMEQQEATRALEKGLEQNVARATNEARTRNKDKRRALTRAAIVAKKGETKAKAAQQVVSGQGKTRAD